MIRSISFICLAFIFCYSYGQNGAGRFVPETDQLQMGDINTKKDTSQIKVISASRSNKNIEDLPITIHVISHEEIIKNQYTSLTDVLKALPGIRVSQPGSAETGESFQLRGLNGNSYTKILLNGIPIKPTVVKGMPIAGQLPVRQAERIEIIYGPAAAVYGADAVSGVINIITKEANQGSFARGDISLGDNEYTYINFILGGKAGKNKNILQYSFYGSKSEFNNMNIKQGYEDAYNPLNYLQKQGTTVNINNKDYDPLKINNDLLKNNGIAPQSFINQYYPANYEGRVTLPEMEELPASSHMIGLNLEYRGFQLSYINMYRSTHSSIGKSTYLYKYNNPQNYWADEISRGTISYKKELFDNIRSTTNISTLSYRMDNNSSLGLTYLDNDKAYLFAASNDLLFEQLFTFVPLKNLEVITGGSYSISGNLPLTNYLKTPFDTDTYKPFSTKIKDQDTIFNGFGYNPITFNNISGFFQGYYMTNNFTFMGGLRYDQNSLYGKSTNPRFAILWKANKKTSFRASVGYAFKAPPASLAYESFAYPDRNHPDSLHYLTLPNSNLSPEQFKAYEFGVNRIFWDILQINISLYYNEIKNLIIKTNTPLKNLDIDKAFIASDSSTVITKENYSNAISKLYGIQGTMKIENLIRPIHLDIEGSVTFAKKSETLPGIEEIGDLIKNFRLMPKHFGQYKVSLIPFKNARLHLEGMWMSEWLRIILPFEKLSGDLFDDIDGFYKMDAILNYSFGRHLTAYVKVLNFFDEKYTGVNAGGLNDNLPLNPQLRRNVRIGLTYEMN